MEEATTQEGNGDVADNNVTKKKHYIDTVHIKVPRKDMTMHTFLNDCMGKCNQGSVARGELLDPNFGFCSVTNMRIFENYSMLL